MGGLNRVVSVGMNLLRTVASSWMAIDYDSLFETLLEFKKLSNKDLAQYARSPRPEIGF
jgi:hypothetical protein